MSLLTRQPYLTASPATEQVLEASLGAMLEVAPAACVLAEEKQSENTDSALTQKQPKKQNKDEANANRTAQIAIVDLVIKEFGQQLLREIWPNIDQVKARVRSTGSKQFISTYLLDPLLRPYLQKVFCITCDQQLRRVIRKNKNSKLGMEERLEFVRRSLDCLRNKFIEHYNLEKLHQPSALEVATAPFSSVSAKLQQIENNMDVKIQEPAFQLMLMEPIMPIPLEAPQYQLYMAKYHCIYY